MGADKSLALPERKQATVVPCREHFVLSYLISFLYFIYVGSNLRTAGCIFPAEQAGSLDHLSLT